MGAFLQTDRKKNPEGAAKLVKFGTTVSAENQGEDRRRTAADDLRRSNSKASEPRVPRGSLFFTGAQAP